MSASSLSEALIREHHEIDAGIEEYTAHGKPESLLRAMDALRRHIYLEEEFMFPPLKEAGLVMPVFVMLREHGEIWDAMDSLDAMLDGEGDPDVLRDTCRGLLAQLSNHNLKEEPVIYPQADALLGEDATVRLHEFIDSGRMPDGWRCEKAA